MNVDYAVGGRQRPETQNGQQGLRGMCANSMPCFNFLKGCDESGTTFNILLMNSYLPATESLSFCTSLITTYKLP